MENVSVTLVEEGSAFQCASLGKSVADVFGLIVLGSTSLYMAYRNARFKGFNGKQPNYCGEHEECMLSMFVNLFAAITYFGRVVANGACQPGFPIFTSIKYFDYIIVCPLLVLDLLWNLESPYKFTCSGLILVTIVHGVAAYNAKPPESYVWFGAGCVVFSITYSSIIYLVKERLKHFNNCAVDAKSAEAVFFLKFASCCFFFVWIWYPLVFVLSPEGTGMITADDQDICHMILDCLAKSLYGLVSISFRARFDKSVLRTIDEEEYVEFSKRSPKRRAITMKISVGGQEGDDGDHAFKIQLQDDADMQSMAGDAVDSYSSLGVTRQYVKSNQLIQPHDVQARSLAAEEGGKAGTRLMFASNRRSEEYRPSSPVPKLNFQQIRFEGKEFGQSSEIPMSPKRSSEYQDKWIVELGRYLDEQGVNKHGIVEETLGKLRGAGLTEQQLRACASEEELKALGIPLGARKAVLRRYGQGDSGVLPPRPRSPDSRRMEGQWLSELAQYLAEAGVGKMGLADDAIARLRDAGYTEERLRDTAAAGEEGLRALGIPMGARKAILRRYAGGGGGGGPRSPGLRALPDPPPFDHSVQYS